MRPNKSPLWFSFIRVPVACMDDSEPEANNLGFEGDAPGSAWAPNHPIFTPTKRSFSHPPSDVFLGVTPRPHEGLRPLEPQRRETFVAHGTVRGERLVC